MIYDKDASCGWKWITLKYTNLDEKILKQWLKDKTETIIDKYELRFEDD